MTKPIAAHQSSSTEAALVEKAHRVLPGGHFGSMALDLVIREGKAGHVWDESGNRYIDYLLGSGPMLVGHAHPEVVEAVTRQVARGTTFYTNNAAGIELADRIVDAVPCAEKVRFCSTGSEATFFALRVARAFRKRDKILKFEGGYHGNHDYAHMSTVPKQLKNFPNANIDTAGIPKVLQGEVLVAPFNDAAAAAAIIEEHRDDLGAVICEPMQRLIPPKPGFLKALRDVTAKYEIPLIFDEIVTGFRLAYGGGQQYYGVTPDLCALGKIVGGGYPLGAIAGRADIMAHFEKSTAGDAFAAQSGTLNGNPVAAVAGLATLDILRRPGSYDRLFANGRLLRSTLVAALAKSGLPSTVVGEPPLFDVVFAYGEMSDYRAVARGDGELLRHFNAALLARGILKGDNKIYVSLAHTETDIAESGQIFDDALKSLQ
jgi:glutamate-1-semialdehyde 2,1-aminomutase